MAVKRKWPTDITRSLAVSFIIVISAIHLIVFWIICFARHFVQYEWMPHVDLFCCRERIRGKDIRVPDRVFMVQPENPHEHLIRTKTHIESSPLQREFCGQRALTVA